MCLTIPKKVIDIKKDSVIVEDHNGRKQELKSITSVRKGDYVLSQQNIVIEKIDKKHANEILGIINK